MQGRPWLGVWMVLILAAALAVCLSWRGAVNVCVFLLLFPALYELPQAWRAWRERGLAQQRFWLSFALGMLFCSLAIGYALRNDWASKPFDSPLRIFLCIPLLYWFAYRRLRSSVILGYVAPITLLLLLMVLKSDPAPSAPFGGRFTTAWIDPNMFGVYSMSMLSLCLFAPRTEHKALRMMGWAGILIGCYLVMGAQTRAAWAALALIGGLWLWWRRREIGVARMTLLGLALAGAALLVIFLVPGILDRVKTTYSELAGWYTGSNTETSSGVRITMWHLSWLLFKLQPWQGYGEFGYRALLTLPEIQSAGTPEALMQIRVNGPHNDLCMAMLRSGIWGAIALLSLFLIPLVMFWRQRHDQDPQVAAAARMGVAFVLSEMVGSVAFEVVTLKYTASIYGLVIAALAAHLYANAKPRLSHD